MGSLEVLLVEDDETLREVLSLHLAAEGYRITTAASGREALTRCESATPDLVLLDVMLPELSGLAVCAELRRRYGGRLGVVMLTALGGEPDVVCGFDVGADDYVVKPVRPRELVARLRSLARRLGASLREVAPLTFGRLTVQTESREVSVDAAPVRLTATEWELFSCLVAEPRRVLSRAQLLEKVFDTTHRGYARNVDCHITRLRRKLEAGGLQDVVIETVHGAGYRFVPPC